jgi:hypothetical protein
MRSRVLFRAASAALLLLLLSPAAPSLAWQKAQPKAQPKAEPKTAKETRALPIPDKEWTGDFDGMKKRRLVRVLTVYNKTNYFIDKAPLAASRPTRSSCSRTPSTRSTRRRTCESTWS